MAENKLRGRMGKDADCLDSAASPKLIMVTAL